MAQVTRLEIPQAKVQDYLLDIRHPEGFSKARFFLARGFRREYPDMLANAVASQAIRGWPGREVPGMGAIKHRIMGPIFCPDGRTPDVLTSGR